MSTGSTDRCRPWPEEVNAPFAYDTGMPPSIEHPMGTDSLGQDILARILYGGRISISVGIVAALVAITIGTFIGAMAGFFVVPMNALLQHRGHVLLSAGRIHAARRQLLACRRAAPRPNL